VRTFYEGYTKVTGKAPGPAVANFASFYYAPVKQLVAAMQSAGSVDDIDKITAALVATKVAGLVGDFSYNNMHQALVPIAVCKIVSGSTSCVEVPPGP
jgi:hypothetical protein